MTILQWRRWWRVEGSSALRLLALERWDPIGVYGEAETVDEYDAYLARLARMLRSGDDAAALTRYLGEVRTKALGLDANEEADAAFAEALAAWYADNAPH